MARYSKRTGPAVAFELVVGFVPIPGMQISRHYDNGELLIISRVQIFNGTAAAGDVFTRFTDNGNNFQMNVPAITIPAGGRATLTDVALRPISEGIHTITLDGFGLAAAGDQVEALGAELVVIQLPLWDSPADIL